MSDPVKIVIASSDFCSPSETFVRRHADHLFGGRTAILSFEPVDCAAPGRPVHVASRAGLGERLLGPLLGPGASPSARRRDRALAAFLRETGAAAVMCEFGYVATKIARPVAEAGVPVFCYFRGADASKRLRNAGYVAALRDVFPHLSGVFAVSRFLVDRLAAVGLTHPETVVIPSGTDTAALTPGETEPAHILSVGRMVPKKDYATALAAFARLAPRHPDLRWTILGTGPMEHDVRAQATAFGITDRIRFEGVADHGRVLHLMRHATAYVQAFRTAPDGDTEGMPSAVQEAMAAGRAIVTTDHAGVPEHIRDGVTGFLAAEGDVDAFADRLDRVLSDAALRDRLGAAARAHAMAELDYRDLYAKAEAFIEARITPWAGGRDAGDGP